MSSEQQALESFEGESSGNSWKTEKFEELMESMRNGLYKKKDFYGEGNQIVKMGELFGSEFITNKESMDRLELSEKEINKHGLEKGDLLFARRSYVREGSGKCSIVDELEEPLVPESSIIRARPDQSKVLPKFVYYFFKSVLGRQEIKKIIRQTAVSGIAQSDLKEVEVPVPSKEEQKAIVEHLIQLDRKIETNERIKENLEELAQTLFKSWFVDFEPYEDFKDSEHGEIPEDFEAGELSQLVSLKNGKYIKKEAQSEEGEYPVYGSNGKTERTDDKNLEERCVTIGRVGSIGEIHRVEEEAWISDNCIIAKPDNQAQYYYLYLLLTQYNFEKYNQGSSHPMITQEAVKSRDVAIPSGEDIEEFERKVEPLFEEILRRKEENEKLEEMRDTLLPKLMSGEIRVNVDGDE